MNLRGVLFDYGMVLSGPAVPAAHEELVEVFGTAPGIFDPAYWANRQDYDAGLHDGHSYWRKVARDAAVGLTTQQIEKLIAADLRMWGSTNDRMLIWARTVARTGLRTGILSNMCGELLSSLEQTRAWLGEFPYSTWSCRTGAAKPDPAIYRAALDRLGVSGEEVLFIDDKLENILAANDFGIHGIVFQDIEQLQADLDALGFSSQLPRIMCGTAATLQQSGE